MVEMSSENLVKPVFSVEPLSLSTKKDKNKTPNFRRPPRPPAKTCPPVSRCFPSRPEIYVAQSVTFLGSADGSLRGTPFNSNSVYDKSNKKLNYFEQAFQVKEKIGSGFFGTVYRVISKEDGKEYAVKIANEKYRGRSDRSRKLEEVRKHEYLLPHSNCVHFYGSWEENGRLYQQFELCSQSLQQYAEFQHEIPEKLIWSYLIDLLLAVQHLHENDLIHMDIKPENIFIGRDGICKLGDFGIVIDLKHGEDVVNAVEGDPKYLAAEVLDDRNFSKAADVFALGVTLLELSCDVDLPQSGSLWHKLRNNGPDPTITSRISPKLRRIISLMMCRDAKRRPTVQQLLEIPDVKQARCKRENELKWNSFVSNVQCHLTPGATFIKWVFILCCWPFKWIKNKIVNSNLYNNYKSYGTPPQSIASPGEFSNASLSQFNSGAFSSDEEEGNDYSFLSSSSSLASPLHDDSSEPVPIATSTSPNRGFRPMNRFNHLDFSPRPHPRRLITRDAQTTPGGMRFRSRFMTRKSPSGFSPQKRLDFDACLYKENHLDQSLNLNGNDDSGDSDVSVEVKPVVLADKFKDCFSDSD